jgi:hypothetical protein
MAEMGAPEIPIDLEKLKALMRLKPTLKDTAAFFECSEDTIENRIRQHFNVTFSEFRDKNMVHTRLSLIRKAMAMAENGNVAMLIFCLKNMCEWKDKFDQEVNITSKSFHVQYMEYIAKLKNNESK